MSRNILLHSDLTEERKGFLNFFRKNNILNKK